MREYARRRKCSHTAVRRAIMEGRITDAVVERDELGRVRKLDFTVADLLWEKATDPAQARSQPPPPAEPPKPDPQRKLFAPDPEPAPAAAAAATPPAADRSGIDFKQAATAHKNLQVELAKLELEERRGRMLDRDDVRRVVSTQFRAARDRVLQCAPQLAAQLALESDPAKCLALLLKALRDALDEAARGAAELGARG